MAVNLSFNKSDKDDKMLQFQKEGKFTDFNITVGEKAITCHRIILAATCNYFNELFKSSDSIINQIKLNSLKFEAVQKTVLYLYGEDIKVDWEEVKDYVEVGHELQIPEIKNDIGKHIAKHLTTDNCLEWFLYAEKYQLENLSASAIGKIVGDIKEVCSSDAFKELNKEYIINFLNKTGTASEITDSLLTAAIEWVDFNPVPRKDDVYDVISQIHLDQCSPGALKVITEKYEDLLTDPLVMKLVYKTVLPRLAKLEDREIQLEKRESACKESEKLGIDFF